jgi:1,4-dihydroxy-6-naphthoate synthase
MALAFSPCPNDTFIFHAWVHGLVAGAPPVGDVRYADIDVTNGWATQPGPDLLKISYAALPWALEHYALLPCGGALGHGCGPLVLVAEDRSDLVGARVAVPALRSTAYLLFRLWATGQDVGAVEVRPFHEIMPAVRSGTVDAGLVIHEARFTYPGFGLRALVDLGQWWERDTGLPIPLGAVVVRRGLDRAAVTAAVRGSLEYAWRHPEASRRYVGSHAQEMDPAVQERHIGLYVNEFSHTLGEAGHAAVEALLGRSAAAGLLPRVDPAALR